jgi:hypothetical protein
VLSLLAQLERARARDAGAAATDPVLFVATLDLSKAFDRVSHDLLFGALRARFGVDVRASSATGTTVASHAPSDTSRTRPSSVPSTTRAATSAPSGAPSAAARADAADDGGPCAHAQRRAPGRGAVAAALRRRRLDDADRHLIAIAVDLVARILHAEAQAMDAETEGRDSADAVRRRDQDAAQRSLARLNARRAAHGLPPRTAADVATQSHAAFSAELSPAEQAHVRADCTAADDARPVVVVRLP